MAINKKNVGKKVYFDGEIWTVKEIIQPNKFDDYLLLTRKIRDAIHEDHKTIPVDLICIDAHNDTFYPYNKKTKKKIDLLKKKLVDDTEDKLRKVLEKHWLTCFPEDY